MALMAQNHKHFTRFMYVNNSLKNISKIYMYLYLILVIEKTINQLLHNSLIRVMYVVKLHIHIS